MKKNEQSLKDLLDTVKPSSICLIGILERGKRKGQEYIWKKKKKKKGRPISLIDTDAKTLSKILAKGIQYIIRNIQND